MIRSMIRTQRADPLPATAAVLVTGALATPWLFGFDTSHAAVANHIAFAMAFGPIALMATALRAAAATCTAGGVWLVASPWMLGYASTGTAGWLADVLLGAALVAVAFTALSGRAVRLEAMRRRDPVGAPAADAL
jgi:hypothetical protein